MMDARIRVCMAPQEGHTTNVSSAPHPGLPEIIQDESGRCEAENGRVLSSTNRPRPAGPEIWFRIIHSAVLGQIDATPGICGEQEVAVAFGPIGIADDGRVGVLTRRFVANQVVRIIPLTRRNIMQPRGPEIPRVTKLLRMAIEWRRQLDAGDVQNKAEIARREGITRARVTQVMSLLRLAPGFQEQILTMSDTIRKSVVTERRLRPIINGAEGAHQEGSIASLMS